MYMWLQRCIALHCPCMGAIPSQVGKSPMRTHKTLTNPNITPGCRRLQYKSFKPFLGPRIKYWVSCARLVLSWYSQGYATHYTPLFSMRPPILMLSLHFFCFYCLQSCPLLSEFLTAYHDLWSKNPQTNRKDSQRLLQVDLIPAYMKHLPACSILPSGNRRP